MVRVVLCLCLHLAVGCMGNLDCDITVRLPPDCTESPAFGATMSKAHCDSTVQSAHVPNAKAVTGKRVLANGAADVGSDVGFSRRFCCPAVAVLPCTSGMPPSWALRPGVFPSDPGHVERAAAALYGEGVDINRLRCWRRKLIKHHDSVRPPFYGSVPRSTR